MLRESYAHGANCLSESELMHHDHVHVALYDDDLVLLTNRDSGQKESEEDCVLFENKRFPGIEVFWVLIGENCPGAKATNLALMIMNRKHHPISIKVIITISILIVSNNSNI
jgi:hypothetical protein